MTSSLSDRKWSLFLKRIRPVRFVPFVDFVMAAGSLATGKIHEQSDFDVLVGVGKGRIFTARFIAILIFEIHGYRRRALDHSGVASDKICLNHFVTPSRYRLNSPHDGTLDELYSKLVPVLGDEEKMKEFFEANDWLKSPRKYVRSDRYLGEGNSWLKRVGEALLNGKFGDWVERKLKNIQVKRVERGLEAALGYKGRVIFNDQELQFHPDRSKWVDRKRA